MKIDLDWPSGTFIFTAEDDRFTVVGTPDPATDSYAVLLYLATPNGAELVATATATNATSAQELARLTLAELALTQALLGTIRLPWN
jgi:hypothetical protein